MISSRWESCLPKFRSPVPRTVGGTNDFNPGSKSRKRRSFCFCFLAAACSRGRFRLWGSVCPSVVTVTAGVGVHSDPRLLLTGGRKSAACGRGAGSSWRKCWRSRARLRTSRESSSSETGACVTARHPRVWHARGNLPNSDLARSASSTCSPCSTGSAWASSRC